ncbi:MAG: ketoacyl-ACP synthase III [Gammaproteobacteria bacterium]|nr:ketoacyl-ACP synthase III [Gammaproteobacteria bacterium]
MTDAVIRGIAIHLPEDVLTNEDLDAQFPEWEMDKIAAKNGIQQRHIVAEDQTGLDLAEAACRKMFAEGITAPNGAAQGDIDPADIDALIYCTQAADYLMPTNACILQHRLGLPTTTMAFDFNLGCSGWVYGLSIAKGFISTGQAKRVLLVTTDVYSRWIREDDRSIRSLFGDAACATLIEAGDSATTGGHIRECVYGTDGSGAANIVVTGAGMSGAPLDERSANRGDGPTMFMDGPEVFRFTLAVVPKLMQQLYEKSGESVDSIDQFILHQANKFMLEHLRRKLKLPKEKFILELADVGNTVSNTIPIALGRAYRDGRVQSGQTLALVGFGVGLSWGGVIVDWR